MISLYIYQTRVSTSNLLAYKNIVKYKNEIILTGKKNFMQAESHHQG